MLRRLRFGLADTLHDASAFADAALHETTIRLAVTGLSRAGKTVLVTSLVHNLLALGQGRNTLPALHRPLLDHAGNTRLRAARLLPPGSGEVPAFEHARHLAALADDAPAWPLRTDDLAELAVELVLDRQGALARRLGPRRVRLEILDYPGEWLLDLPLLAQEFHEWSADTLELLRRPPRRQVFDDFLAGLAELRPDDPPDHDRVRRLHEMYRDGLRHCRDALGLRLLQPGRFVCPGPRADAPFMWFFPLPDAPDLAPRDSLAALLAERFENYKADMRARFFEAHFNRFDRQLLLVDVLGALHAGREAFEDTAAALALITNALSYGANWPRAAQAVGGALLRLGGAALRNTLPQAPQAAEGMEQWLRGRTIERVAVVATKADHVPALRRDNLRNLLRAIVERARAPAADRPISFHTAAALAATVDDVVQRDGLDREVVRGVPLGAGALQLFDPGDVPSGMPPEHFWGRRRFELPVFEPPRLDAGGTRGVPHIGLDEVLAALIGDAL